MSFLHNAALMSFSFPVSDFFYLGHFLSLHLLRQALVHPELGVSLGLLIHTLAVLPTQQHLTQGTGEGLKGFMFAPPEGAPCYGI